MSYETRSKMSYETKPILESNNFIVLDEYKKIEQTSNSYQSERS